MKVSPLVTINIVFFFSTFGQTNHIKHTTLNHTDANGYTYQTVTNDPAGLRVYKLKNGLTVYLGRDLKAPSINYATVIRAGSAYDPKNNTGLAHYLEHLLFNGTDSIGTLNWKMENPLLNKIDSLYEEHKREADPEKKKYLDHIVDSISYEASKYGIKGEYRKLMEEMGGVAINGTTNFEYIIYGCIIPNTSLGKLLTLEKERFSNPSLRAFRNELEIVYEEFNTLQDNDFFQKYLAANAMLFKNHPYGQQAVIGTAEHLKNPSLKAIRDYFNEYYVPNNMAIVLIGNLNFDKAIQQVDKTFSSFKAKAVHRPIFAKEKPIDSPRVVNLFSNQPESAFIGFRLSGIGTDDEKYLRILHQLLNNRIAGILSLDLADHQKVKSATSDIFVNNDYSMHFLTGTPVAGQTLEDVKSQLLSVFDKIKKGDFDAQLIKPCAKELRRNFLENISENNNLDAELSQAFIHFRSWDKYLQLYDDMENITKQQLIDFVNRTYNNNYVVVYKRKGDSKDLVKVENPHITPILLNEDKQSEWGADFLKTKPAVTRPEFIDFKKTIRTVKISNGLTVKYIPSENKELFKLDIVFDIGKNVDKKIPLSVNYISLMDTRKYTLNEWKKEFYKLGLSVTFNTQNTQTVFHLEGLQSSLLQGIKLLNYVLDNGVGDTVSYQHYIKNILNSRQSALQNTASLNTSLALYALYGENSIFRDIYSESELRHLSPKALTDEIRLLRTYPHQVLYYGNKLDVLTDALAKYYRKPDPKKTLPPVRNFVAQPTKRVVYVIYKEGAQAQVEILIRGSKFSRAAIAPSNMFNRFIEKVDFQQIREARSLAYNCWAAHLVAADSTGYNYMEMYAGTQSNKLNELLDAETGLIKSIDNYQSFFSNAKNDQLKRYERERITRSNIFWTNKNFLKQGINFDFRENIYHEIQKMNFKDMLKFFGDEIAGRDYTITVIADKKDIDKKTLSKYGQVIELEAKNVFNYK